MRPLSAVAAPLLVVRSQRVEFDQILFGDYVPYLQQQILLPWRVETALQGESKLLDIFISEVLLETMDEVLLVAGVEYLIQVAVEVSHKIHVFRTALLTVHA